jgi:signal transduction histidine kinase
MCVKSRPAHVTSGTWPGSEARPKLSFVTQPSHSHRLLLGAGFLTWGVVGLPKLGALLSEPARLSEPASFVWLLAYVAFGVAFWRNASAPEGRERWQWLAVQTVAALAILGTSRAGFEGALLAMVAGQAPSVLSSRQAFAWVGAQTLGTLVLYLALFPAQRALLSTAIYAGFQAFALGVALMQQREAHARRELARLHAELQGAQVLLAAREREGERLRIARELHDSLGHHLTALSLNLEAATHTVPPGPGVEHVRRAQAVARTLLSEVREVVSTLRETALPLEPSLRALVREVPGLAVHLQVPEALALDEPASAWSLFRCVQEVITNTLRHASARNLWIDVSEDAGGIRVHARDDGRGASSLQPGAGLTGMRERFVALGGRVELRAGEGQGLELEAWLPARRASA